MTIDCFDMTETKDIRMHADPGVSHGVRNRVSSSSFFPNLIYER